MHGVLDPLIKQGNSEALFLAANVSRRDESEGEFERRHLEFIKQSATAEYPPALYTLGFYYDMGDAAPVIPHDTLKAAQIFKRGAELKHAHCQHLHAEALLYGAHGIEKDVDAGMAYLRIGGGEVRGFAETAGRILRECEFGLPVDLQKQRRSVLKPKAKT
jgi:TPR repeat protein